MARTWFFYLPNTNDCVQCFFCTIKLDKWAQNDDAIKEHLRWSPKCPLMRRKVIKNVPLDWELLDWFLPEIWAELNPSWALHSTGVTVRQIHAMMEDLIRKKWKLLPCNT